MIKVSDMFAPCRYREDTTCTLTKRDCFGMHYDPEKDEYYFDRFKERSCPSYEPSKIELPTEAPQDFDTRVKDTGQVAKKRPDNVVFIRLFGRGGRVLYGEDEAASFIETEDVYLYAEILQSYFKKKYGDQVIVEGIDITSDRIDEFPMVKEILMKEGINSYVVMINDTIRFIGDPRNIPLGLIRADIERLGVKPIKKKKKKH